MNIQENTLFINGSWQAPNAGNDTITAVNPATAQPLQTLRMGGAEDVDAAVLAAKNAFADWKNTAPAQRAAYLNAMADELEKRRDALLELVVNNNGKPRFEAQIDLDDAIACYRYYAELITQKPLQSPVTLPTDDYQAHSQLAPMGVAALIVPWNFPLVTTAWKVAPALAAGCTVVLKPSEITPLPELQMGEIVAAAGLPAGVFNLVIGGAAVGHALTTHRDVAKVSFTGSNAVGEKVMQAAAPVAKNISLELGGKSSIIVCENVDIAAAVELVVGGIFYNAGQMCSATSRLLVQETIATDFFAALKIAAEQIVIGNGFDEAVTMGAITHRGQYDSILRDIEVGKNSGLTLLTGGDAVAASEGFFIQPTVFIDVPSDHQLWREEIFGPVLCARTFSDEADAIAQANDSDYGLAATVVSRDETQANRIAEALNAGHIWINTLQVVFAETSWGGYGKSGIGRELGPWGLSAYQEVKHIVAPKIQ